MLLRYLLQGIILLFVLPCFAQMQVSGISLTADNSELDNENGTVILSGNVQVIYKGFYLSCDKAVIHRESKKVVADGNVVLQSPTTYTEATKAIFNFETERGLFYDSFIQSGKVVFEGDVIEKTGENTYEAVNGRYTACSTCPPAWSFSGRKIEAELGGYANISYPILRVADFPVFVLPRILVPLKSKRQSGFLVPTMSFGGSNGVTIGARYFWAISQSQDMTFTLYKYETRGWKGHGEYRYVLDKNSKGYLRGAYIYDQAFTNCVQDCDTNDLDTTEEKTDRGFVHYKHHYKLPGNLVQRSEIAWITDLRYLRDFPEEIQGAHGKSALENNLSLSKSTNTQFISGEVGLYRNLLAEDAFADNDDAVHRLPDLRHSIIEQRIGESNALFRMNTRYTNFARNTFGYDDICTENETLRGTNPDLICDDNFTNDGDTSNDGFNDTDELEQVRIDTKRDGEFNPETDLLRTGQRLDVAPTVSYPIPIGKAFRFLPAVTYRETQYQFDALSEDYSSTAARRYVQFDASLQTLFSGIYGDTENKTEASYKHEIEPELIYSRRPWVRRPNHVFFGDFASQPFSQSREKLNDEDLFGDDESLFAKNKLQFDYEDRLFEKNLLSIAITNRLVQKLWSGSKANYKNTTYFRLIQSYDFEEAKEEDSQPWSDIDAILQVRTKNFDVYSFATYFPYANATNSVTRIRLKHDREFFEVSHKQTFTIDDDNDFEFDKRTESLGASIGFDANYLALKGGLVYNNVTFEVQSWKFDSLIKFPGDCWGLRYSHWFNIGSAQPEFRLDFAFDFSGESGLKFN